ncbi:hypothetical protein GLW03_16805 [Halobacillus halophilus]|uniref:DUF4382 domain-containing protein n=1 Tax=Halobacillus halophilus TaxID=1570 RepID=UPI0013690115|nr:DUF4382 domain-containing protein [Halobacillus halophilus]MYL31479.1 hypothetical protein [Halobacillus halophilus]
MKYLLYSCLLSSVILLNACNENQIKNEDTLDETNENEKVINTESNNPDEKNMFSLGDFEVVNSQTEVGSVTSGPITIEVLGVSIQQGELKDMYTGNLPDGEINFIRLDFTLTSEQDDLIFDGTNIPIKINSEDKWIEPNTRMSVNLNFGYNGEGEYRSHASYVLEESTVDEVKTIVFQLKAPKDKNGQPLGEDQNINVELTH